MIKLALKALGSMLLAGKRMPGRSWGTEYFARIARIIFAAGEQDSIHALRGMLTQLAMPDPVLKKISAHRSDVAGVACLNIAALAALPADRVSADRVSADRSLVAERIIVYLHGGAYVVGAPEAYKTFLALIAINSDARIIAPDYRLSPEYAFPAAQDDCLAVVKEVREKNPDATLIIMGDSAGGALSVATSLAFAKIDALMLISPWVDPTADSGSIVGNAAHDIFTQKFLLQSFASHIQLGDRFDQRLNFLRTDLSRLPQTYIQAAGGELFHDQVVEFAQRAERQGASVELDIYPTQFHVFQVLGLALQDTRAALAKIGAFIKSVQPRS